MTTCGEASVRWHSVRVRGRQRLSITVAQLRDVAEGTQPGDSQSATAGGHTSLADLDPIYERLLDEAVTATVG